MPIITIILPHNTLLNERFSHHSSPRCLIYTTFLPLFIYNCLQVYIPASPFKYVSLRWSAAHLWDKPISERDAEWITAVTASESCEQSSNDGWCAKCGSKSCAYSSSRSVRYRKKYAEQRSWCCERHEDMNGGSIAAFEWLQWQDTISGKTKAM